MLIHIRTVLIKTILKVSNKYNTMTINKIDIYFFNLLSFNSRREEKVMKNFEKIKLRL